MPVDPDGVPLAEGAAAAVLAAEPDGGPLQQQRAEGQSISAKAQSTAPLASIVLARAAIRRSILGLRWKPSGTVVVALVIAFRVSYGDPRLDGVERVVGA